MKTLLNCDDVFERLTRAPFPAGDADDEGVERHLEACHECRQLAEALRPAVSCFDAARREIATEQTRHASSSGTQVDPSREMGLPVYRGRVGAGRRRSPAAAIVVSIMAALLFVAAAANVWHGSRSSSALFVGGEGASRVERGSSNVARTAVRERTEAEDDWFRRHLHSVCQSSSRDRVTEATYSSSTRQQCCTLCHSLQVPQAARPTQVAMSRLVAACLLCHEG